MIVEQISSAIFGGQFGFATGIRWIDLVAIALSALIDRDSTPRSFGSREGPMIGTSTEQVGAFPAMMRPAFSTRRVLFVDPRICPLFISVASRLRCIAPRLTNPASLLPTSTSSQLSPRNTAQHDLRSADLSIVCSALLRNVETTDLGLSFRPESQSAASKQR